VVCFPPRHDLSLPELSLAEVEAVVRAWTEQTRELGATSSLWFCDAVTALWSSR
jgi:UDPglucose--hexose-1-phosphate uridylyltransferase